MEGRPDLASDRSPRTTFADGHRAFDSSRVRLALSTVRSVMAANCSCTRLRSYQSSRSLVRLLSLGRSGSSGEQRQDPGGTVARRDRVRLHHPLCALWGAWHRGRDTSCVRSNRSQGGRAARRGADAPVVDLSVVRLGVSAARSTHRVRRVPGPAGVLSLPDVGLGPSSPGGTERLTRWTITPKSSSPSLAAAGGWSRLPVSARPTIAPSRSLGRADTGSAGTMGGCYGFGRARGTSRPSRGRRG